LADFIAVAEAADLTIKNQLGAEAVAQHPKPVVLEVLRSSGGKVKSWA
jgi:hypothetical protein